SGVGFWPWRCAAGGGGVFGCCPPPRRARRAPPTEILRDRFGPDHYIVRFQEPGAAEALFARDLRRFFRMMMRPGAPRSRWAELVPKVFDLMGRFSSDASFSGDDLVIDTDDLEAYLHAYERSGLHGGINLYRNIDANNTARADADPPIAAPSLYVGAENDVFLPPEGADPMAALVPDHERHVIPDCGHWITHEAPDALNAILIDWLTRRFPASAV
ncbi:MAG: alpha/beta fold hydrolase, partial [Parvularculaceae bacterium]